MIELDNEGSAALLRNGLSKVRIDANIYKWFKPQMVQSKDKRFKAYANSSM